MTQEPERLPHGFRERLDELFSNLRQGVLYLRRLVLPSSGLMIGESRLSGKDDGDGNTDPYWRRPDGTESNLSLGGSEGGAPADAQYVTLAVDGDLEAERVLTAGEGIDLTDGGANSTITVTVDLSEISAGGDLGGTMEAPTVDDGADSTAIHDNVAGEIVVVTEKTTPVANDEVVIEDSADSNNKKSLRIGNIDHDTLSAGTVASHDTGATGAELDTLTDGSDADALHDHATLITATEAITAVEGEATLDLTGDVTIAAAKSLAVDTIGEKTGAAGIKIDGVWLRDKIVGTGYGSSKPRLFLGYQIGGTGDKTASILPAATMTDNRLITFPDASGELALDSELHAQAHGPSDHTEGTAWRLVYQDASGDEQEIGLGTDGQVLTSTGAASAPAMEALPAGGAHGIASHTEHANWKLLYTDGSGDEQELALTAGPSATAGHQYLRSTSATGAPELQEVMFEKTITVEDPTASEDIAICFLFQAVTIREVQAVVVGTSCTIDPYHNTDRSGGGGATDVLDAATLINNTTTGQNLTSFTDATIPADSWLILETTTSTSCTELTVTFRYTVD